jgi:polar amino acid transport system permease protein
LCAAVLFATLWAVTPAAHAATPSPAANAIPWGMLVPWLPAILKGFVLDVLISVGAMIAGTVLGGLLGIGQISPKPATAAACRWVTQFFRNAPWLVILFFCVYLLPFQLPIGNEMVPFPGWLKGTFGLSLAVMGNISEVVRGAIQSLPTAQWEAASALGLNRRQTLRLCILPQAVRRMMAPWMNTYAILAMATPLVSIVGVEDSLSMASAAAASLANPQLMMPIYGLILILFFVYCAPISIATTHMERRLK